MNSKDLHRFMSKVQKTDGCWLWIGGKDGKGYGKFSMGNSRTPDGGRRNSMVSAHRLMYEHHHGPIPPGPGIHGFCVLHRCDMPGCVRPDHLFLGTNKDNVRDMDSKGRRVSAPVRGERHGNAILDSGRVLAIYQLAMSKAKPQAQIARDFGVCLATVNHIKTGRLWAHVTGARA